MRVLTVVPTCRHAVQTLKAQFLRDWKRVCASRPLTAVLNSTDVQLQEYMLSCYDSLIDIFSYYSCCSDDISGFGKHWTVRLGCISFGSVCYVLCNGYLGERCANRLGVLCARSKRSRFCDCVLPCIQRDGYLQFLSDFRISDASFSTNECEMLYLSIAKEAPASAAVLVPERILNRPDFFGLFLLLAHKKFVVTSTMPTLHKAVMKLFIGSVTRHSGLRCWTLFASDRYGASEQGTLCGQLCVRASC